MLASGALSDRLDRRRLMIAGDLIRLGTISAIGLLSIAGELTMPVARLASSPCSAPDRRSSSRRSPRSFRRSCPEDLLVEANSLAQFVRPASMLFLGPLDRRRAERTDRRRAAPSSSTAVTFAWSAVMIYADPHAATSRAQVRVSRSLGRDRRRASATCAVRRGSGQLLVAAHGQPALRLGSVGGARALHRHERPATATSSRSGSCSAPVASGR